MKLEVILEVGFIHAYGVDRRDMKLYFALNFYISIKLAYESQFINLRSKLVYSALQTYAFPKV